MQFVCTGTYSARSLTCHDKESVAREEGKGKKENLSWHLEAVEKGDEGDEVNSRLPALIIKKGGKKTTKKKSGKIISKKEQRRPRPPQRAQPHTHNARARIHTRARTQILPPVWHARTARDRTLWAHKVVLRCFFFFFKKPFQKKTWLREVNLVWV